MITTPPTPVPLMENSADSAGEVLQKIKQGFHALAELHAAISNAPGDPSVALEHVSTATRELAAIQRLFDRRSDR